MPIDCKKGEEAHGWEMGALLARLPREVFRMPLGTWAQPLCLLHIRTQQDLLPDLQGIVKNQSLRLKCSNFPYSKLYSKWKEPVSTADPACITVALIYISLLMQWLFPESSTLNLQKQHRTCTFLEDQMSLKEPSSNVFMRLVVTDSTCSCIFNRSENAGSIFYLINIGIC